MGADADQPDLFEPIHPVLNGTLIQHDASDDTRLESTPTSDTVRTRKWKFLAPAEAEDELGRLGSYRVLKELGKGGMGVVFLAEDIHLHRPVALKVMLPALASVDVNRKRFLREARAATAVKHDNIVVIYQVGEDRGTPYLAMEFLEGESLQDRLEREPRVSVTELLRIGREMAAGLDAAHAKGLIHRDIKPANVWLEGKSARVKILDFGLARSSTDTRLTEVGKFVGTPAYVSPEQARGLPVDARSDIFSLGCMLYQMCTGKLPFRGDSVMATLTALAVETPPTVKQFDPKCPQAISDLIAWMLAKEPADRPQSMQDLMPILRLKPVRKPTAQADQSTGNGSVVSVKSATPRVTRKETDRAKQPEAEGEPPPARPKSRLRLALLFVASLSQSAIRAWSGRSGEPSGRATNSSAAARPASPDGGRGGQGV